MMESRDLALEKNQDDGLKGPVKKCAICKNVWFKI